MVGNRNKFVLLFFVPVFIARNVNKFVLPFFVPAFTAGNEDKFVLQFFVPVFSPRTEIHLSYNFPFPHSSPRTKISLIRYISSAKSSTHFKTIITKQNNQKHGFMFCARRDRNLASNSLFSYINPFEHIKNIGKVHLGTDEMPKMVDAISKCSMMVEPIQMHLLTFVFMS